MPFARIHVLCMVTLSHGCSKYEKTGSDYAYLFKSCIINLYFGQTVCFQVQRTQVIH